MVRHIRVLLALAVLAPLMAWASPAAAESRELIVNGYFRSDPTADWHAQDYSALNSQYGVTYTPIATQPINWWGGGGYTGQDNNFITLGSHGVDLETVSQLVMLPANATNIKVRAYYLMYPSSTLPQLTLSAVGAARGVKCDVTAPAEGSYTWSAMSCTLPEGSSGQVNIVIKSFGSTVAYVSGISVTVDVPSSPPAPAPVVTPPVISLTSPTNGSTVQSGSVTIAGTIKSPSSELTNYYYWYNEKPYYFTLDAQGNFSVPVTLTSSDNWFVFVANNRYGLESRQAYQIKYKPTPRVLGVSTSSSTLTSIILKNGKFQLKKGTTTKTIQPFPGYTGKIYAKRIEVAPDEIYFIFVALDAGKAGKMVIYNQDGNVTDRNAPFGAFKPGYNVSMLVSKVTSQVFIAVAPKKWGNSVSLFEIQAGKFVYIEKAVVGKKTSGDLRVKLMSPDGQSVVLATGIMGKKATRKSWRYSEFTNSFIRTVGSDRHVRMNKTALSWK